MHLLASIRWWLVRARWPVWGALAAVALIAGWMTGRHVTALDEARRSWGETRAVWVSVADIEPGESLKAQRRDYPAAVVPARAITSPPAVAVARQRLAAGQILTDVDVSPAGPAALIPDGWIAVPVADESGSFRPGDSLVAFADGRQIAAGVVVASSAQHVTIAVPAPDAAVLAGAVAEGRVSLGLLATPPGSPAAH